MPQQLSILRTKLFVVRPQGNLIRRTRLSAMLGEIPHRRLTLLSAPAGFGKTTLLGEWIEETGYPTAWLSLDAADNDLKRFVTYLIGSLRTLHSDIGRLLLEGLEVSPMPPMDRLLTSLINEVAGLPEHFLLVLDDYHRIENQEIHDVLLFLLDHAPEQFHIALTTRVDPHLPLSRFRVRGEMLEIRATDLRFSDEEAAGFFKRQVAVDLSPEQIAALQTRTEGWIAGLKMAALSIEGRNDIERFIDDFTGADRYVLDYLIEEVINRQPPELQAVMLELSILDRFNGALCEAVTGYEKGAELLEQLERANLFLIPLDNQREWYRYHHLFSDLLQHRLRQANGDLIPELHRRASVWFESNGLLGEALIHAVASNDIPLLANTMEKHWEATIWQSEGGVIRLDDLLPLLPDERIAASIRLSMLQAWLYIYPARQFDIVEEALNRAEKLIEAAPSGTEDSLVIASHIAILRAVMARDRGDGVRALEYGEEARRLIPRRLAAGETPRGDTSLSLIMKVLGAAYAFAGKNRKATEVMEEALEFDRQSENIYQIEMSLANLARQCALQGALNSTDRHRNELITVLASAGDIAKGGEAVVGLLRTRVDFERAAYTTAIEAARNALKNNRSHDVNMETVLHQQMVLIYDAMNDPASARRELETLDHIAIPDYEVRLRAVRPTLHAVLNIRSGNLQAAEEWGRRFFHDNDPTFTPRTDEFVERTFFHKRWEQLVYARLLIELKQYERAHQLLDLLRREFDEENILRMLMETLVMIAVAYERQGAKEKALETLVEALKRGASDGYIRPFSYNAREVAEILSRIQRKAGLASGIPSEYIEKVAAACGLGLTVATEGPQSTGVIPGEMFQLTSREQEILQLMSLGYSNQKIADKLYVSINTIKTHTSNLFSKLEARNRVDALVRAREAGLL